MTIHAAKSVRRPAIGRVPAYRTPFAPRPPWRAPRWLRAVLIAVLTQLLLLAALTGVNELHKPTSLAGSTLTGKRLVTGPICIEEAVDVSGSMTEFTGERERAEQALFDFSRRELQPDDTFAAAFFAGSGTVALRPSPMDRLAAAPTVPAGLNFDGTQLAPAVRALVAARTRQGDRCAARALVAITDGIISDPDAVAALLPDSGYARVFAVVPVATGWGRPQPLTGALDSVTVYHFTDLGPIGRLASVIADAKPLDVVLGDIVGSLTGQQLEQQKKSL